MALNVVVVVPGLPLCEAQRPLPLPLPLPRTSFSLLACVIAFQTAEVLILIMSVINAGKRFADGGLGEAEMDGS